MRPIVLFASFAVLLVACGDDETPAEPEPTPEPVAAPGHRITVTGQLSCAIGEGARVACWGALPGVDRSEPVLVPELEGAVGLTSYGRSVCSRDAGGTVKCWGPILGRVLGAEHNEDRPSEIPALRGATSIALGDQAICGVVEGSVRCGIGRVLDTIEPVGIDGAVRLERGSHAICAERAEGPIACLSTRTPPLVQFTLEGSAGATAAFDPSGFPCALADGQLRCIERWLSAAPGQDGAALPVASPAEVPLAPAEGQAAPFRADESTRCTLSAEGQLSCAPIGSARGYHAEIDGVVDFDLQWGVGCALKRDGSVACFGANGAGQSGPPPSAPDEATQVVGVEAASAVAASPGTSCALTREGALLCWTEARGWRRAREVEGVPHLSRIVSTSHAVCGVSAQDGTVVCVCDGESGPRVVRHGEIDASGGIGSAMLGVVGRGADGVLRHAPVCAGSVDGEPTPDPTATELSLRGDGEILGDYRAVCLLNGGALRCVEEGGRAPARESALGLLVAQRGITRAAFTAGQACVTTADSTRCVGRAAGLSSAPGLRPVAEIPADVTALAMSPDMVCFRRPGEALRCARDGAVAEPSGPTDVAGIAVAHHQACAVTDTGEVWCSGAAPRGDARAATIDEPAVLAMPW